MLKVALMSAMLLMALVIAISVMSLYSDNRSLQRQLLISHKATEQSIESTRIRLTQGDKTNNEMHALSRQDRVGIHATIVENSARILAIETWITSQKKGASK